ncbi:MAG: adenylosuccinate synthetase [Candidatus Woesearchaeota archaeon]
MASKNQEKDQEEFINKLFQEFKIIAVVCNQWGDTGKGKIVDLFSKEANVVIRGNGGSNAGHTIKVGNKEIVLHLIPSGILHENKLNIIGRGVAVELEELVNEIEYLKNNGIDVNKKNLMIDGNAKIVLPWHKFLDSFSELSRKIGTTKKGIGYCIADHYLRIGLTVNDLYSSNLEEKLRDNFEHHRAKISEIRAKIGSEEMRDFFENKSKNDFYDEKELFSTKKVSRKLRSIGDAVRDFVGKTENAFSEKKKILLEGAQGLLLSVDYGTTLSKTSSETSYVGLANGCSLNPNDVGFVIGIVKAYMTRVGNGPFPTEFGSKKSEDYCSVAKKEDEEKLALDELNLEDEFEFGIYIRKKGNEYGATTARPRRTGWLDLVALNYAVNYNGPYIVITKADILSNLKEIKTCIYYTYIGEERFYNGNEIKKNDVFKEFILESDILRECVPNYKIFKGWSKDISKISNKKEIPKELNEFLEFIKEFSGARIIMLSLSPERYNNVIYENLF